MIIAAAQNIKLPPGVRQQGVPAFAGLQDSDISLRAQVAGQYSDELNAAYNKMIYAAFNAVFF